MRVLLSDNLTGNRVKVQRSDSFAGGDRPAGAAPPHATDVVCDDGDMAHPSLLGAKSHPTGGSTVQYAVAVGL